MSLFARLRQPYIWPVVLLIAADGLIVLQAAPALRFAAALVLLAFLPGWIWLQTLLTTEVNLVERSIIAIGLSFALTVIGAMGAVYLPGPFDLQQILTLMNLGVLAGAATLWWQSRHRSSARSRPVPPSEDRATSARPFLILLAVATVLLVAFALRLPRLGYAEFHEDEAEALMLGVRLLQGEDYALFLHRKGPAQMLVPVAFWILTGRITELTARFPFALSSFLSVAALVLIGRRWFNWPVGILAGLFWAVNGYAIAFGRMVQYQALIFFLGPLAIYCLYLAWKFGHARTIVIAALMLAACLLAHFDALFLLPAAAYLGWLLLNRPEGQLRPAAADQSGHSGASVPTMSLTSRRRFPWARQNLVPLALALTLLIVPLASFYIPYMLDPEIKNTLSYLSETRVKPGLLYNNLPLLAKMDKTYSSHLYLPWLVLGVAGLVVLKFGSAWGRTRAVQSDRPGQTWAGTRDTSTEGPAVGSAATAAPGNRDNPDRPALFPRLLLIGLVLLLASTIWFPQAWRTGSFSLALIPWLALGLLGFKLFGRVETRVTWIMAGSVFIGYTFLVEDPRSHFYMMYPGAALLAAAGWVELSRWLFAGRRSKLGQRPGAIKLSSWIAVAAAMLLFGAIVVYEGSIFLSTESAFGRLWANWDESIWESIFDDLPGPRSYFGYPKREGWKTIGALRAMGKFPGDFRSMNEDFIVPIWYNFGQARSCYTNPAQIFVRAPDIDDSTSEGNYAEVGRVKREGEIRLHIFSSGADPETSPASYTLEAFENAFDRLATPEQFSRQAEPAEDVGTRFGPAIQFEGYELLTPTVAPGETLYIDLYWRALDRPDDNYRAFVHLTDGTNLWGQQDDTPACRLPTSIWRARQRGVGQFRLPVDPLTPPGRYALIVGLYQAETLERLEIVAGAGQPGDDFLWLLDIEVVDKQLNADQF